MFYWMLVMCLIAEELLQNDEQSTVPATTSPGNNETIIDEIVDEKEKNVAKNLIKSMRRLSANHWYLPNNNHNNDQQSQMNHQPKHPTFYKRKHAHFANGWRVVPLSKLKFPIKDSSIGSSTVSSTTNLMTTTTTETSIPTSTSSSMTIESSTIEMINQPVMTDNHDNDTYALKCNINGIQYSNGDQITSTDDSKYNPCTYCRCFYGQKICQQHICPSAPSLDCIAEQKPEQCCPFYTCKSIISESIDNGEDNKNEDRTIIKSRGPQFINKNNGSNVKINEHLSSMTSNHSHRRNEMLMPIANSLEFLYNSNNDQKLIHLNHNPNRIHFPSSNDHSIMIPTAATVTTSSSKTNDQWINSNPIQSSVHLSPIRTQPQSPIVADRSPLAASDDMKPFTLTTSKPIMITNEPTISTTMTTATTLKLSSLNKNEHQMDVNKNNLLPNIFQISGCNIYGKMYKTDEIINELTNKCKTCLCTNTGVKCNNNDNHLSNDPDKCFNK